MSPSANLQRAMALHQQGHLVEAQALYDKVLAVQPSNFDALHLSGVVAAQRNQPGRAKDLIVRALRFEPHNPAAFAAHTNLASAERILGEREAALGAYERALALKDDYRSAHASRADLLCELGRWTDALAAYDRTLALGPEDRDVHRRRANVLCQLGRWDAALMGYDRAIALKADVPQLHCDRAFVLSQLRQWEAALASCDRAIALQPDYAEAHANRGNVLKELKRFEEALQSYARAMELKPRLPGLRSNKAAALTELMRWHEALAACEDALRLEGDYAELYCNQGLALHGLARLDEAVASYDRAIRLRADFPEAWANRGYTLAELRRFEAALASYERALALRPDYAEARCNRALVLLLLGRFAEGWPDYEWRWASKHGSNWRERREFSQPLWRGRESLEGKRILLHSEQGLGDTIQFCRYMKPVAERGASVILEVQRPLLRLLSGLEGVAHLCARGDPLPEFDLHCSLLSLPLAFGTELSTIPSGSAYLRSDAAHIARWRARLGGGAGPRIGLAWSGSMFHNNDHRRSVPLALLLGILPAEFRYVTVQNDVRPCDRAALRDSLGVLDLSGELQDFADTAALCECLDMVISVDTSVAHLCAALGKPTWILLPFTPDWRWLLDRTDTPWYASAKLYRQNRTGDWGEVLERVAAALRAEFTAPVPADGSPAGAR